MPKKAVLSPFVKWAGGKRQLLEDIKLRMPKKWNMYFEPFLGGGAVLFEIAPKKAVVNDINPHLINAYKTIRDKSDELIEILYEWDNIQCDKDFYYIMRDKYNNKIKNKQYDIETAALFIYLNKRCFNGLYRVNSKGLFNVPFNNKKFTNSFTEENIKNISKYLKNIDILNKDFEDALPYIKKGDFVFFDSPYAPLNEMSFEAYTKEGFDKESHIRLSKIFKQLDELGCYLMLTNHNTSFINELYKKYNIEILQVKRMINAKADFRKGEEVIITNYG